MLLASVSNGLVFGLLAYAAALMVGLVGRRHRAERRDKVGAEGGGHA